MVNVPHDPVSREYRRVNRRSLCFIVALIVGSVSLVMFGFTVSENPLGFSETYRIIINHITGGYVPDPRVDYFGWLNDHVVMQQNVPRVIGCVLVGSILAVSGAVMQPLVRNPMADPFTTGISSGALLGASLFIVTGFTVFSFAGETMALVSNAFVFALIPAAVIILIMLFKKNISPNMMILAGIGVMYMFTAASTLLRYSAESEIAHEIFTWSLGSMTRVNWDNMPLLLVAAIVSVVFGLMVSKYLNALSAGDSISTCLGIDVRRFRLVCLVFVAIVTAIAVSFTGTIGFVGLVCPHIARILVGSNNRYTIPCAAVVGVLMLTGADLLAKSITVAGLPVGAITALIGSPIFIYLLIRQRRSAW